MGDPRKCAIFVPAWGSNWGSSGFSRNQNNRRSSGAHVTCIYCGLSVKINTRKTPHGAQRSWTHLYCICFARMVGKNPKTPNLSPMADDAITRGDKGGLGSSACICRFNRTLIEDPMEKVIKYTFVIFYSRYWTLQCNRKMKGLH